MKVVKVYGALRKRLGQCRFEFDVATPAQALKALCVNFPGLERWLMDSEKDGVGYRVTIGRDRITDDLSPLAMPWSEKEVFSITPVVAGAGRGAGMIAAGIGLVALAIVLGPASGGFIGLGAGLGATSATVGTAAAAGIVSGAVAGAIGLVGVSLVLFGVAQAISPQPEPTSLDESAQLESFTFSNVVNTSKQGLPVPIAYGRVFAGAAVLSSSLDVDQKQA